MEYPTYGLTRELPDLSYEEAVEKVTAALESEGFGILTEIDVKATLKKKLDTDFRKYIILGACNPHFAYQALSAELLIGLLMPCNVIVAERDEGGCIISAINPVEVFGLVNRSDVEPLSKEVSSKLQRAIDQV